jgi:CheY-like chemotaxis protein
MGLSFEQVDEVLGGVIDGIVSHAAPLRIEMVGHPDRAWRHVAALVRALVTCETKERNLEPGVDAQLAGADLVLVDVDRSAAVALALLERLAQMSNPPPVLALCAGNNPQLRAQAGRFATVVSVPVDSDTMQAAVLTALGQVAAAADG